MYLFINAIDINICIQNLVTMTAVGNKHIVTEINHFFNHNFKIYDTFTLHLLIDTLVITHLATNHIKYAYKAYRLCFC